MGAWRVGGGGGGGRLTRADVWQRSGAPGCGALVSGVFRLRVELGGRGRVVEAGDYDQPMRQSLENLNCGRGEIYRLYIFYDYA